MQRGSRSLSRAHGACSVPADSGLRTVMTGTDAASVDISKKRPIEEGFDGDDRSKRANLGADPDKPNAIKVSFCTHPVEVQ